MKKFLTTLHRWLGFPLGLLFIVTFGTGCLTAVDELLMRVDQHYFSEGYQYRATTLAESAYALEQITQNKTGVRQVLMPSQSRPYYQVVGRGETWTYAIDDLGQTRHNKTSNDGFFHTVLGLHRNYLLGREGLWGVEGKYYAAWVGLIALLISSLGLWLWWPLRKTFAAKDIVPRGKKRKHFYYSHMTSGVVVLVVIVLMALTGASISYRAISQDIFGVDRDKPATLAAFELGRGWQPWLRAAYAQMPEGSELDAIRYPRQRRGGMAKPKNTNMARSVNTNNPIQDNSNAKKPEQTAQLLEFRFHTDGDWLWLAGSKVKIDKGSSMLVDAVQFSSLAMGEKMYSLLKPLHTGRNLPFVYVLLVLGMSVLGTVMVLSGLVSFVTKKRKWLKRKRRLSADVAVGV